MTPSEFWALIQSSDPKASQDTQAENLKQSLFDLDEKSLIAFDHHYRTYLAKAHRWELWGAAYVINGGCSDDGFDYFKDWLISRGQDAFESALEDPETLKGLATAFDTEFEEFRYIMMDVFKEKFAKDLPVSGKFKYADPSGNEWGEEELDNKYPILTAWVKEQELDIKPSVSQAIPVNPKKSFWQKLFGK